VAGCKGKTAKDGWLISGHYQVVGEQCIARKKARLNRKEREVLKIFLAFFAASW